MPAPAFAAPALASAGSNAVVFAVVIGVIVVAVLIAAFWWGTRRAARRRHPHQEAPRRADSWSTPEREQERERP